MRDGLTDMRQRAAWAAAKVAVVPFRRCKCGSILHTTAMAKDALIAKQASWFYEHWFVINGKVSTAGPEHNRKEQGSDEGAND
jgi:hypothetical protein